MYHHIKKLMYTVQIGTPDPKFGNMLLEQFGGANGELAAAMLEPPEEIGNGLRLLAPSTFRRSSLGAVGDYLSWLFGV